MTCHTRRHDSSASVAPRNRRSRSRAIIFSRKALDALGHSSPVAAASDGPRDRAFSAMSVSDCFLERQTPRQRAKGHAPRREIRAFVDARRAAHLLRRHVSEASKVASNAVNEGSLPFCDPFRTL